jgi:GDP-L-fucose synthase
VDTDTAIYVAGHTGLVGSAITRELGRRGFRRLILAERSELDLREQQQVRTFFERERPEVVFLAAGKVGGVYANDTYRAEFLYENLIIESNVIHQAFASEVRKLVYFGCSCMYPSRCPQPMREDALLTGELEPTNEPFAVAKLAGVKMCESYRRQYGCDFISIVPTNLHGINQNYTPLNSLVIPALIRRFHEAKIGEAEEVAIWGTGKPARDFLFADDLADAAIFLAERYSSARPINVGTGAELTIREAAEVVQRVVGYEGKIVFDESRPDGVLVKLQDVSAIRQLGWQPKTAFEEGIRVSYDDFVLNHYEV